MNKKKSHKILERQLRNLELSPSIAPTLETWNNFLDKVRSAYEDHDQDRYLLERSLAISSREMAERWKQRIEQEELIKQQQATLVSSAKLSILGEMATGMAHEINNPLTVIQGKAYELLDIIADENTDLTELKTSFEKIITMTDRIAKIIRGLKAFARESNGDPMEKCTIKQIVNEAVEMCQAQFKSAGVPLIIEEIPDDAWVSCRPVQIIQVILNLLRNAFDAIRGNDEKWIKIKVEKAHQIKISIIDSGTGIAPEIQEKLMQPFFTTKPVGQGTGLGLSISRGIIESHHGKLILNTESKNTCFEVYLENSANKVL